MESDTAVLTNTEVIPTAISPGAGSASEEALTAAITELWSVHVQAQSIVKKTKAELKAVRDNLAEKLFEMKKLLVKPGRGGMWFSFISERGIPRTSADRLVSRHEKMLNSDGERPSGAITDEDIEQLAKSSWARVGKKIETHQAKYQFFSKLIIESRVAYEEFDDGILVLLDPVPTPEPTAPAKAPVEDVVPPTASSPLPAAAAAVNSEVAQ